MPTISTQLQLLPQGFAGKTHRATDGTVYSVVEGHGMAEIAGQRFDFGPRDTFVVPSWAPLRLSSPGEDTVLFSFSDRPVQQAMGILREAFLEEA
jgi:gentisate 1,2-dioxygenase